MENNNARPINRDQAEQLIEVLKEKNPNWIITRGLAESFSDKLEIDSPEQPQQIDVVHGFRTGNKPDIIQCIESEIQQQARQLFGHSLCDDAISVRPQQIPMNLAGTQGHGRS
jgi:hypothetical protein